MFGGGVDFTNISEELVSSSHRLKAQSHQVENMTFCGDLLCNDRGDVVIRICSTYLQGLLHLGGLVTFSLPHGTVTFVPLQAPVHLSGLPGCLIFTDFYGLFTDILIFF